VDIAYLCSPNNPTGAVASRENLAAWVAWARECDAVLIFDAAYDAFIQDPALPRSIYEIEGARECAIEMRSFSKRAGFTGLRCAYTVVPKILTGSDAGGARVPLNELWARRHSTKFNGVPYPVQRAAEAVFTPEGRKQTGEQVSYYMTNAARLREGLGAAGFEVTRQLAVVGVLRPPAVRDPRRVYSRLRIRRRRRRLRAPVGLQLTRERRRSGRAHPPGVRELNRNRTGRSIGMEKQLREHLEELHSELESTEAVDDRSRELLGEILGDIQTLLDRSGEAPVDEPEGLVDRLREATRNFEESHPTLAAAVGRVVDALSNLGI
jgi:hypothetical protein